MLPAWNEASDVALSCGTILTSPPPLVSVLRPFDFNQLRSDTSCVFPSCGEATVLPFRSAALLIDLSTTKYAPPDAAPETILTPLSSCVHAVIVGFGPMYAASRAPAWIAVSSSVPLLKVFNCRSTFEPSAFLKMPLCTPTSAGAWVTLGK